MRQARRLLFQVNVALDRQTPLLLLIRVLLVFLGFVFLLAFLRLIFLLILSWLCFLLISLLFLVFFLLLLLVLRFLDLLLFFFFFLLGRRLGLLLSLKIFRRFLNPFLLIRIPTVTVTLSVIGLSAC